MTDEQYGRGELPRAPPREGVSADLDALADSLRERLLASADEGIEELVERSAGVLDAAHAVGAAARISTRAAGLGVLEPLLADAAVEEVMVSGTAPVWVERAGRLERTAVRFASEAELRDAIERILAPLGRRVDEAEPLVDARLADGSRVNVVIPPLALDGPALTIRRFRRPRVHAGRSWSRAGTLTSELLGLLGRAVRARCTVLVCGGTGVGQDDDAERAVRASSAKASAWSRSRTPPSCGCASRT